MASLATSDRLQLLHFGNAVSDTVAVRVWFSEQSRTDLQQHHSIPDVSLRIYSRLFCNKYYTQIASATLLHIQLNYTISQQQCRGADKPT